MAAHTRAHTHTPCQQDKRQMIKKLELKKPSWTLTWSLCSEIPDKKQILLFETSKMTQNLEEATENTNQMVLTFLMILTSCVIPVSVISLAEILQQLRKQVLLCAWAMAPLWQKQIKALLHVCALNDCRGNAVLVCYYKPSGITSILNKIVN